MRNQWFKDVPDSLTRDQIELHLNRLRNQIPGLYEAKVKEKLMTVENYLKWYKETDFKGRFLSNQTIFAIKARGIILRYDKSKGKRHADRD